MYGIIPLSPESFQARRRSLQSSVYAVDYLCSQTQSVIAIVLAAPAALVAVLVVEVVAAVVREDRPASGLFVASFFLLKSACLSPFASSR